MKYTRLEKDQLLRKAMTFFIDGCKYSDEKLLIGSYNLVMTLAEDNKILSLKLSLYEVNEAILKLSKKDAAIIKYRFMDNYTLQQCGYIYNCTRERIRQCQERALESLRIFLNISLLRSDNDFKERKDLFVKSLKERSTTDHDIYIEELPLTLRPLNGLKKNGIHTASQLFSLTDKELLNLHSLGASSFSEIRNAKLALLLTVTK